MQELYIGKIVVFLHLGHMLLERFFVAYYVIMTS